MQTLPSPGGSGHNRPTDDLPARLKLARTAVYGAVATDLLIGVVTVLSGPEMTDVAQAAFPSMAAMNVAACTLAGWALRIRRRTV